MKRRPGGGPRSSRLRPGRHTSSPCPSRALPPTELRGTPRRCLPSRHPGPLDAHELLTRLADTIRNRAGRLPRIAAPGPEGARRELLPSHAGSCAAGMPLQPVGHRPLQPGGLLLLEAAATLWTSTDHNGLSGKTTTWRNRRVEPAEQAGVRRGGRRPWMEPSATHRAGSDAASRQAPLRGPGVAWRSAPAQTRLVPGPPVTEEEVRDMIATQASFLSEQRTILVGALELTDRHLREVLIPRRDVVALPANFSVTEAIRELVASTHVRAPVFRGDLNDVIGVAHLVDLVQATDRVADHCRPALALPESLGMLEALRRMQRNASS